MPFSAGETFLLLTPESETYHLYVVLAVNKQTEQMIAVPFNTASEYTDSTTTLSAGDHPFIKHDTHVSYGRMREISVSKMEELEQASASSDNPLFKRHEDFDPTTLNRIIAGAFQSKLVSAKLLKALKSAIGDAT
jgi:hypothetical protein